jgi:ATP-binding cassette subfamily B (MDR/TAP) protein 1
VSRLLAASGAAYSVFEVIDRVLKYMKTIFVKSETKLQKSKIDSYSSVGVSPSNIKGKVEIHNVMFAYPTRPDVVVDIQTLIFTKYYFSFYALNNITLTLLPNECIAVVGASGSGKSTIVNLLLRYYDINSGSVCYLQKNDLICHKLDSHRRHTNS